MRRVLTTLTLLAALAAAASVLWRRYGAPEPAIWEVPQPAEDAPAAAVVETETEAGAEADVEASEPSDTLEQPAVQGASDGPA
jgi:hypothetical protein